MEAIEIKGLTKTYGKNRGIENVNLTVKNSEIFGFIGQNGAGKSTTIRLLMNLIFPTCGESTILGLDVIKESKKIKSFLAYVPSEVNYYRNIKTSDLIKYTIKLNGRGTEAEAEELCKYFELDQTRTIGELSLGNRKKVSLVQALLKDPKVIILDEPTSGLDPLMQEKLFKKLLEEKEKGACIFLSSHNLSEVEKYCDRVAIIKDGLIVDVKEMKALRQQRKIRVIYMKKGEDKEKSFIFNGDINDLTKELAALDLLSLKIEQVSLEDEFMKYYKEVK